MKTIAFITRVHPQRPEMLKACIDSVKMQTDNNYVHVIYRDDTTKDGYGILLANQSLVGAPAMDARYVMILDDDNMLIDRKFVGIFKEIVNGNNPELVFYKVVIGDRVYPPPDFWKKPPVPRQIDSHCFAIRLDIWRKYIHIFGEGVCGDYSFISKCYKNTSNHFWLDREVSSTQREVGRGKGKGENENSLC